MIFGISPGILGITSKVYKQNGVKKPSAIWGNYITKNFFNKLYNKEVTFL